jgi:hypothetical protein
MGGSIANVSATMLLALGHEPGSDDGLLPPLDTTIVDPRTIAGARITILLVVDGLAAGCLDALAASGMLTGVERFHLRQQITSVFPSTTAAALTSLLFGVAPSTHGIAGYTLFIPGQRRVVNMIKFRPVDGGAFRYPVPGISRLANGRSLLSRTSEIGIETVVVSHHEFASSPLTQLHADQATYRGYRTIAEFAGLLLQETTRPGRRFIFAYYAGLDMLSHRWGPAGAVTALDLGLLWRALTEGFFEPLGTDRDDITVILTSDHGHHALDSSGVRSLVDAVQAAGRQRRPPTGERRATAIALRQPECIEPIRAAVEGAGTVLSVESAIAHGLYGPAPVHPELRERIGDWLLVAHGSNSFSHSNQPDPAVMLGAHGSLTADEMLVPLWVARW